MLTKPTEIEADYYTNNSCITAHDFNEKIGIVVKLDTCF